MFRRLLERFRSDDASVQFEVQRMTAEGGWNNFMDVDDARERTAAYEEPPDPPLVDGDSGYPPGTYRCVERRDGRINEVVWRVETPNAEEFYDRQRQRQRQRERIDEMTREELADELENPEELEPLEIGEVLELYRQKEPAEESYDEDLPSDPIDRFLAERLSEGSLDETTLERVRSAVELKSQYEDGKRGLCYRCFERANVQPCQNCGDLVCEQHRSSKRSVCLACLESGE